MRIRGGGGGGGGGGTIPGLSSDGANGIIVEDTLQAGDEQAATFPDFHILYGATTIRDVLANLVDDDPPLLVWQRQTLSQDNPSPCLWVNRTGGTLSWTYTAPLLHLNDSTGVAGGVLIDANTREVPGHTGSLHNAFSINAQGGLGLFGKAPPTAPRTLAQATITAITDANAKAAIQAIANALADMGVLTLT